MIAGIIIAAVLSVLFGPREVRPMKSVFQPGIRMVRPAPPVIKSELDGRV